MDPEDRKLLIEIHGTVAGIKPVMEANASALRGLDERQRRAEIMSAEHGVKIERIQGDLDGLGRKVRAQLRPASAPESGGSRWLAFLEVMAALPKYAHVLLTLGSLGFTAAVVLWRHWPHGGF